MWNKLKAALGFGEDPEVLAAKSKMQFDHQDARKRFVFGVLAMSYEVDPAYLSESRQAIRDWYGINSAAELADRIGYYLEGSGTTPGYDAFRAAFLARAAVPAGLLSDADSWLWAFRAARKVQQHYPSFRHYGMGYLEGHLAYRKSCKDSEEQLDGYRANLLKTIDGCSQDVWAKTTFNTPLVV